MVRACTEVARLAPMGVSTTSPRIGYGSPSMVTNSRINKWSHDLVGYQTRPLAIDGIQSLAFCQP